MHDRVADDRELEDVRDGDAGPRGQSGDQARDRVAHGPGHRRARHPRASSRSETRLMRSSPNRICGFITPSDASTSPSARFARWPAIVVEPDVDRDAERAIVEARPDAGDDAAVVDRHGDAVAARLEGRLEGADHLEVGLEARAVPTPAPARRAGARGRRRGFARSGRSSSTSCSGTTGSMTKSRTGTPLRTTWRWTWLSGGTSTSTSPLDVREAAEASVRRRGRGAGRTRPRPPPRGERWPSLDSMPCLGKLPSAGMTWQRPQLPRPPQTESRSTPSERAASRRSSRGSNRPRRPDGREDQRASRLGRRSVGRRRRRQRRLGRQPGPRAAGSTRRPPLAARGAGSRCARIQRPRRGRCPSGRPRP